MLEHSRGVTGERREVDLNALVDEALNLAYHGARAQDQSFNITLEREFDGELREMELAPQEMTRVFLNLFGNGFYAATKRARENGDASFRPTLTVATRDVGKDVEIGRPEVVVMGTPMTVRLVVIRGAMVMVLLVEQKPGAHQVDEQRHPGHRREQGQIVPAVFYDQADRRRDRPRPVDQLRHRHATARRHDHYRQRTGRLYRIHHTSAALRQPQLMEDRR